MAPNNTDGCIPGYQGYIPALDHVYGKTYKSSTVAAHGLETKLREGNNSAAWKNLEPSLKSCNLDTRPQHTGEQFIKMVREEDSKRQSVPKKKGIFREEGAQEGMIRFAERQDFSRRANEKMGINPWQTQYTAAHSPRRPTTSAKIPGYGGYVPGLNNHVFAQTFTESTRKAAVLGSSPKRTRPGLGETVPSLRPQQPPSPAASVRSGRSGASQGSRRSASVPGSPPAQ